MSSESANDAAPRYVAPQAIAAVPLAEEQPSPKQEAVIEGDRAAVPTNREAAPIAARQSVVTSDGYEIGHVKEVSESHFKVDVPMRSDFWIASDDIAESGTGLVVLRFPQADLDAHALERPAPGDSLLSSSEQSEQREHMEAELAVQRDEAAAHGGRHN